MSYRLDIRNQKKGTYLVIEEKYRDKEKKQARTKHYKTLGYVHNLQKEFPDPIAHFVKNLEKWVQSKKLIPLFIAG